MKHGELAQKCGFIREIKVMKSYCGWYIGTTMDDELDAIPLTRESEEYYPTWTEANNALKDNTFTQRYHP